MMRYICVSHDVVVSDVDRNVSIAYYMPTT